MRGGKKVPDSAVDGPASNGYRSESPIGSGYNTRVQDLSTINGRKLAISRSYYAMYHSARTVIFHYGRADVEGHEEINKRLPSTLPNRAHWGIRINGWREKRNQVDYSPYPNGNLHVIAEQALVEDPPFEKGGRGDFLDICTHFLQQRGVPNVWRNF